MSLPYAKAVIDLPRPQGGIFSMRPTPNKGDLTELKNIPAPMCTCMHTQAHTCMLDEHVLAVVIGLWCTWHAAHLALVQVLGLSLALHSNVLILGSDLIDDAVQVQLPVIVHGQDDGCVTDMRLHLSNLLGHNWRRGSS